MPFSVASHKLAILPIPSSVSVRGTRRVSRPSFPCGYPFVCPPTIRISYFPQETRHLWCVHLTSLYVSLSQQSLFLKVRVQGLVVIGGNVFTGLFLNP